jgi:hypothetical protein
VLPPEKDLMQVSGLFDGVAAAPFPAKCAFPDKVQVRDPSNRDLT